MTTPNGLDPTLFIVFGAGGDLTWRKLVPALYNLHLDRQLPETFALIGIDRSSQGDEAFRGHLREGVDRFSRRGKTDDASWTAFAEKISILNADFTAPEMSASLRKRLDQVDKSWGGQANRVFYLAIPPTLIEKAAARLKDLGLCQDCS